MNFAQIPANRIAISLFLFTALTLNSSHSKAQDVLQEGLDRLEKARELYNSSEFGEALNQLDVSEPSLCNHNSVEPCADAKILRSQILRKLDDSEEAARILKEVETLIEGRLGETHELKSKFLNSMVFVSLELLKPDEAERWMNESLELAELLGDTNAKRKALIYNVYGSYLEERGNYQKSVEAYLKSIEIIGEPDSTDEMDLLYNFHNNAGVAYGRLVELDKSLFHYEQSYRYLEMLGFPDKHQLAMNYNNRGAAEFAKGDIGKAIEYFEQSRAVVEDLFGFYHSMTGGAYNNIGFSYYRLQEYEKAAQYLETSMEIKREVFGENHTDTAIGYSSLAIVYMQKKDYEEAIKYFKKSISIRENIHGETHPVLIPAYAQTGSLYLEMGELNESKKYFERAYSIADAKLGPRHPDTVKGLMDLGNVYGTGGDFREAEKYYTRADQILSDEIDAGSSVQKYSDSIVHIKALLAELQTHYFHENGDTEHLIKSLKRYEEALSLIDEIQYSYGSESSKLLLVDKYYHLYGNAVDIAGLLYDETGDEYYLEAAFSYSEISRARLTTEQLLRSENTKYGRVPEELLDREAGLNLEISDVYQSLHADPEMDTDDIEALRKSLFKLNREKEKVVEEIRKRSPDYYNLKYGIDYASIKELQDSILNERETLLSYVVREEDIKVFVIDKNESKLVTINDVSGLDEDLKNLRESIESDRIEDFTDISARLYKQLFKPLKPLIKTSSIIIIPDQVLHYLPFGLLVSNVGDIENQGYHNLGYLIGEFSISYNLSSTLLRLKREKNDDIPDKLLAAAPFSEGDGIQNKIRTDQAENWQPLPLSGYEVAEIANQFNEKKSKWSLFSKNKFENLAGASATETMIKNGNLSNFGYLHFATHGFVNDEEPYLSGIVFSGDDENDGILYVDDIFKLRLKANLVVLSACETAGGKLHRGEGILGFIRAFIYAGTSSLVTTHWKVDDLATAKWMVRFYEEALDGKSYANAVQTVKKEFIADPETANPRYWSSFILHGK